MVVEGVVDETLVQDIDNHQTTQGFKRSGFAFDASSNGNAWLHGSSKAHAEDLSMLERGRAEPVRRYKEGGFKTYG